jgi:hypothetical protein
VLHPEDGNDWLADGVSEDMFLLSSKSNDLFSDEGFPECSQQEGDAVFTFGVV